MKTAKELGITEQQRANLAKLAFNLQKHAKTVKKHFKMSYFATLRDYDGDVHVLVQQPDKVKNIFSEIQQGKCNTSCCALGWAPAFGIEAKSNREGWQRYGARNFIGPNDRKKSSATYSNNVFNFLFAAYWPNSPMQAAKRIAWFLKFGPRAEWTQEDNNLVDGVLPKGFKAFKPNWKSLPSIVGNYTKKRQVKKYTAAEASFEDTGMGW